jgi:Ca-activated chloride channel family protein
MRFMHPFYLSFFLILALLAYLELRRKRPAMRFPDLSFFRKRSGLMGRSRIAGRLTFGLTLLVLTLVIVSLARPQKGRVHEEVERRGVDIMLCLDISSSMQAEDFAPKNRLFVAKERAKEFISGRKGDRIGLVIFSAGALTQCPLTFDHGILEELLDYVDTGIIEDGTAIGMGLATAVSRFKESKAKEKLIVLLTDGVNNAGEIDPISAARLAQALGVKVYCIGVGSEGAVPYPVDNLLGRRYVQVEIDLDMEILKEIAEATGGEAFRATDEQSLRTIYEEIDKLEPTTFTVSQHTVYAEKAGRFLLSASLLFIFTLIASSTLLRSIP